ncbi:putative LIGNIN PEROXIDASE LIPJ domain protein [Mycobacterium kansasii]|uniref:Putative LIGNIN PEROXIDASE LIPJ domain protein n=1 Tax=Mycobacterium kansasii TaxID=1768 RepID=A0A1V3XC55_MYCKA|nr:putative LIGNIN PEROXIDASE LIPJ domain protein [Mycobacterium kansasii]
MSQVPPTPRTRYARCGDLDIAYQVLGDGPIDLLVVPGRPFRSTRSTPSRRCTASTGDWPRSAG